MNLLTLLLLTLAALALMVGLRETARRLLGTGLLLALVVPLLTRAITQVNFNHPGLLIAAGVVLFLLVVGLVVRVITHHRLLRGWMPRSQTSMKNRLERR